MRRPNNSQDIDKNKGQESIVYTHAWGGGGSEVVGEGRELMGRLCPPSMSSGKAIDASVVSRPLAVPALDPASGTRFMGAFPRSSYPDLTRLFDTDSLLAPSGHDQLHFMSGKKV